MIILDTNVLSELMKPQGSQVVKDWVARQARQNLFITSITQAEILYGIAILPDGKRSKLLTEIAQRMFEEEFQGKILNFEEQAAINFAQIAASRKAQGQPISQFDAQIAAICLVHQGAIATRNVEDFKDCQVEILNPWEL